MEQVQTDSYVATAAELLRIVLNEPGPSDKGKDLRDVEWDIRQWVIFLLMDFDQEERVKVMKSFFSMVARKNINSMKVVDACFFFERLQLPSNFPLEPILCACIQEDTEKIRHLIKTI